MNRGVFRTLPNNCDGASLRKYLTAKSRYVCRKATSQMFGKAFNTPLINSFGNLSNNFLNKRYGANK